MFPQIRATNHLIKTLNCILFTPAATCENGVRGSGFMKVIAEYLVDAVNFERLAEQEKNEEVKAILRLQAQAYRKLAIKRAEEQGLPVPDISKD